MSEIASLSRVTKEYLAKISDYFERENTELDIKARQEINFDRQCALRIQIAQNHQRIADIDVLIAEVPTLEDAVSLAESKAGISLANHLIAS